MNNQYKLDIKIQTSEDDEVYQISSKAMDCSYVIKKDSESLTNEIQSLIEEWVDLIGS